MFHVYARIDDRDDDLGPDDHALDVDRASRVGERVLQALVDGGGGHEAAGTCQVDNDDAEAKLNELIAAINADG